MSSSNSFSPYVGLRPFREEDFQFFFGRDREIRVIASNLQTRPLTVLYGASGVGKSSVLQAGVVRRLKEDPAASVLYFREWQSDALLQEVVSKAHALAHVGEPAESVSGNPEAGRTQNPAFLLLDQFEEFLLYHASDHLGQEFDSALSRLINRKDCPVNVLIGIRDDSLSKLDRRFGLRIPNLLRDTLEVERLTPAGAKSAIEKPLIVFSKVCANGNVYAAEPALVAEVLQQVQSGQVAVSESAGVGSRRNPAKESRIETAFLQLVLTKLWEEEQRRNSPILRVTTLHELGGADNIVRSHVNDVMNQLASDRERDIAANMFRYLVTPSRSKIAQATKDLVAYAERPETEVKKVLDALTDRSESRILRRLSDPEQYEIFHDVLAQPLLDWRRTQTDAKARKRFRSYITAAAAVVLLLTALSIYALHERSIARQEQSQAQKAFSLANATEVRLASLSQNSEDILIKLHVLQEAQAKGAVNDAQIANLKTQLDQNAKQAQQINENYQKQQDTLNASVKRASQALQELAVAQTQVQTLNEQLATANSKITDLQRQISELQARPSTENSATTQQNKSKAASPTGLSATMDAGSQGSARTFTPRTLEAGTELCGTVMYIKDIGLKKMSSGSKPGARIWVRGIELPDGLGAWIDGTLTKTVISPPTKTVATLQFDSLTYAFKKAGGPRWKTPVTTVLKSITLAGNKRRLEVDSAGNITDHQSWSLPEDSNVCVALKQSVVLDFPATKK